MEEIAHKMVVVNDLVFGVKLKEVTNYHGLMHQCIFAMW